MKAKSQRPPAPSIRYVSIGLSAAEFSAWSERAREFGYRKLAPWARHIIERHLESIDAEKAA